MKIWCLLLSLGSVLTYRPLQPQVYKPSPYYRNMESPLYLTPYIESGCLEHGRKLAMVDSTKLEGLNADIPSFSGFITVDKPNEGNMFFWFFPAQNNSETAPVVIWLQGGPGGSSMFGLLKLHGPILVDENVKAYVNPNSWNTNHNMLYIDNPVGAGFSYSNKMPEFQVDVADNLYEFLQQWFTLFPQYQPNPFYPFGESYAGKFVPTIAKRIHEENLKKGNIKINLSGMGIGDGWMSPYHNARYADFLYYVGLIDENVREQCLNMESETRRLIANQQWYSAWQSWNNEFGYFLDDMAYSYYYEISQAIYDPNQDNYQDFVNLQSTRSAIHVGNIPFGSGDVYASMANDFMQSSRHDIEFLLEHYKTLIYDGNFDIICNHAGVLEMINHLQWSGATDYDRASRKPIKYGNDILGYLKSAGNLRLLLVRNAGHMVPMSQPPWAQYMIDQFTTGNM